ncbi:MAG: serine/threonine-protein kinase [Candidatus Melainabacteria bacterium]|nr:serine/threonine-protein kinase [Candidatus Melainabacteria bacterium]
MTDILLRPSKQKTIIRVLLLASPIFLFQPLMQMIQGVLVPGLPPSPFGFQFWVMGAPYLYCMTLLSFFYDRYRIRNGKLDYGDLGTKKVALSRIVEVTGDEGDVGNDFTESIILKFDSEDSEKGLVIPIKDYDEHEIRAFLSTLREEHPNCKYSYSDVIPFESRGLIRFLKSVNETDSLTVKLSKSPTEDAIIQLVKSHEKTFWLVYLFMWLLILFSLSYYCILYNAEWSQNPGMPVQWQNSNATRDAAMLFEAAQHDPNAGWFKVMLLNAAFVMNIGIDYMSTTGLVAMSAVWLLGSFVVTTFLPVIRLTSPTYLFIDKQSIGMGVDFFPWESVESVVLERPGQMGDPLEGTLLIKTTINRHTLQSMHRNPDHLGEKTTVSPDENAESTTETNAATSPARRSEQPGGATNDWSFPNKFLEIDLTKIPDVQKRQRALRLIERYALNANFNSEFMRTTNLLVDIQFTDLWLDDQGATEKIEVKMSELQTLKNGMYQVDSMLGYGGQGVTYLASIVGGEKADATTSGASNKHSGQVVIKELVLPSYADVRIMQDATSRFERGAKLLTQLTHPQVVSLQDYFLESGKAYLVMEYVKGETLRQKIARQGALSLEEVKQIGAQLCEILTYLHEREIPVIHCDFAPDNLIVTPDGVIKLIDFDVARVVDSKAHTFIAGRPSYTPPEQFRGQPTTQSDLFALGAILHFLLKGTDPPPLCAGTNDDDDNVQLSSIEKLIMQCCQFEAVDRPATAMEIQRELEQSTDTHVEERHKIIIKEKVSEIG